jgi:hypothetical protein
MKKSASALTLMILLASTSQAKDILDPDFYEEEPSVKEYISKISKDVESGIHLAEEFKTDISVIKADQLELNKTSLENSYKIEILALKQGVINKKVEILENQDRETRKLLSLLSQGVEKSLRFVNGFYGIFGWLAGVLCTMSGGLIVIYVKKYLVKKKRLDNV